MFATNSGIIERHTVEMRSLKNGHREKFRQRPFYKTVYDHEVEWWVEWETYDLDVAFSLSKAEYSS